MEEEKNTNEENKKELLVLAYNTWWKLRAITNMAYLKAKAMPEVHFESDEEEEEFGIVLMNLFAGINPDLILDKIKDHNRQYLKAEVSPFDIVPVYNGVSLQKDVKVTEE